MCLCMHLQMFWPSESLVLWERPPPPSIIIIPCHEKLIEFNAKCMCKHKMVTKWQLFFVKRMLSCYLSTSMATPDGKENHQTSYTIGCWRMHMCERACHEGSFLVLIEQDAKNLPPPLSIFGLLTHQKGGSSTILYDNYYENVSSIKKKIRVGGITHVSLMACIQSRTCIYVQCIQLYCLQFNH